MRLSLIISALLHVAILAYAIVGFANPREFKAKPPKPVAVDILTVAEFSELTAGKKDPKPDEKKAPPKKKVEQKKKKSKKKAVLPPKKVEPKKTKAAPKKKAKPVPDEKAIALKKKKAEEKKKAEKKKKEEARKKAEAKKRQKSKNKKFSSDDIAKLLNKIPDAGTKKSEPKSKAKPDKKKPAKGEGGINKRLAASIGAQIKRRIQDNCWTLPIGGRDVDNLVLKITFNLDRGGRVKGLPNVKTPVRGPAAIAVAESAKRAILSCQPFYEFTTRAPDNYKDWREVTMNFDMREMYGGY